jgi:L-ascorbate metabolism protein UlaG (beta-lactamase superfamily)
MGNRMRTRARKQFFIHDVDMFSYSCVILDGKLFLTYLFNGMTFCMKKKSDHFDGRRYYNPSIPKRSFWEILRWRLKRKVKPWPHIVSKKQKVQQKRTKQGESAVTFINHSTVLLQLDGWNILTDPIWSERASPLSWMGPKRVSQPGIMFEDLPPIDIVLLSHNHYDHMDIATLRRISNEHQAAFFVPKGNQAYLKSKGIATKVTELDWWDHVDFAPEHCLYFVPSQHFSARGIFDRNKTLWGGFVIKGPKQMIYFAGDTGFSSYFAEIKKRLGSPTLSLLPIGAFEPRWLLRSVHLSPEEAVKAHLILGSKQSMAIHFGTFQLADEDINTPILELEKSLQNHHLPAECFWVLKPGETKDILHNLL